MKGWHVEDVTELILVFKNGKFKRVYIETPAPVAGEERLRMRFDTEKFIVQTWQPGKNYQTLFAPAPREFVGELLKHKILIIELPVGGQNFEMPYFIEGLAEAMKEAGVTL